MFVIILVSRFLAKICVSSYCYIIMYSSVGKEIILKNR